MPKSVALCSLVGLGVMTIPILGYAQLPTADSPPPALGAATIMLTASDEQSSGLIQMGTVGQFVAKNASLRTLIATAYGVTSGEISGGPTWIDSDHYDITEVILSKLRTPLDAPTMMLQKILADRFNLTFHREQKEVTVYTLKVAENGPRLAESRGTVSYHAFTGRTLGPHVGIVVYPESILLPGRKATVADLSFVLQRFALDCPVLDKTGLTKEYDFDLKFTPDSSQFRGSFVEMNIDQLASPSLFTAIQEQLGLTLEPTKLPAEALVIDSIERPISN
jgi:uncharacterized protein (TIGR03435 family)